MKITGGDARGRSIASPNGLAVRPTASKIRQAFFNILGKKILHARFLDVFAGSGLIGLEALSRGAASSVFVEESRRMTRAIEASLSLLGFEAEVITADFRRTLAKLEHRHFDIIFADPPYQTPFAEQIVELVGRFDLLEDDGFLVVEHLRGRQLPVELGSLQKFDQRFYGQTALSFFAR